MGAIYRAAQWPDKLTFALEDGAESVYHNFLHGLQVSPDLPCLGSRKIVGTDAKRHPIAGEYEWQTYTEVNERVNNFASGLEALNLMPQLPGNEQFKTLRLLALYMKNRPEWTIAEQGCFRQGGATVPMYDTLGPDTVEMIFNETELTTAVAFPQGVKQLLLCVGKCPSFKNLVYVDELSGEQKAQLRAAGITVYSFAEVEAAGRQKPAAAQPPKRDDLATFCYTSGTTGKSKGALLTHRNIISVVESVRQLGMKLGPKDRHLSYLPLAHVFERACLHMQLYAGARVGFYQGDTLRLLDDLATLRPTYFPSVPRLMNRVHDKVVAGVEAQGGLKAKLFWRAYHAKQEGLKKGYKTHRLWDKLVFSKIAKKLGLDCCRYLFCGSAPTPPHVVEFFRIVLPDCIVSEGFGQTETSTASNLQRFTDYTLGNVGAPLSCNEVRLVSVPDMGYLITDRVHGADAENGNPGIPCMGRGEAWFRGHNVFQGYYKMPEVTGEALDSEGWTHSGDIALWTLQGQLKIIDRKKNIFKLSQGEYIAPEKIENVYTKSTIIAQAFVYGDSFQSQLVAIIVPDAEASQAFCENRGIPPKSIAQLCKDPAFKQVVLTEMNRVRKDAKLFGFEHAADIHLEPTPFSPENDILTPTFKLKRDIALKRYQKEIDEMYAGLGGVAGMKGLKLST
eukprot:GGOE01062256.1.p1 GENE.GGOE01062256.1~~GGOE01062256.1.p1  ORF type:complete len:741 (-),score=266.28 GGOE01062256.1:578-2605(-)